MDIATSIDQKGLCIEPDTSEFMSPEMQSLDEEDLSPKTNTLDNTSREKPAVRLQVKEKNVFSRAFRVSAKKITLTYSQVPLGLSAQALLFNLEQRIPVEQCLIATEKHDDGGSTFPCLGDLRGKAGHQGPSCIRRGVRRKKL